MNQAFKQKRSLVAFYKELRGKERNLQDEKERTEKTEEVFRQCPTCKEKILREEIRENKYICPKCSHHFTISAEKRLNMLVDKGSFKPLKYKASFINPLHFPQYEKKYLSIQEKTGLEEGVVMGTAKIENQKVVIAVLNASFFMGSMGMHVGEMITVAIETAMKQKLPLLIFSASGGARMQEGIMSLMQMAKTAAAIEKFKKQGGLYISYLTHPTTGGVSASFAFLGDIMLAEPKALIGFAGPRVIEQTIGEELPKGFQRSEYLLEHGFVDKIVPRQEMRACISQLLRLHKKGAKWNQ